MDFPAHSRAKLAVHKTVGNYRRGFYYPLKSQGQVDLPAQVIHRISQCPEPGDPPAPGFADFAWPRQKCPLPAPYRDGVIELASQFLEAVMGLSYIPDRLSLAAAFCGNFSFNIRKHQIKRSLVLFPRHRW